MTARASTRRPAPNGAQTRARLYEPLDAVLVRAPLLPFERYLALGSAAGAGSTVDRSALAPEVRRALAVASSDLLNELDRGRGGPKARSAAQRKLLRYLIRMATRPTPFGLFAGVALAGWGERTDLALGAARTTRTRPDMGWLLALVRELESRPAVRRHLALIANTGAVVRAGRVCLAERATRGEGGAGPDVSIRATRPVLRALELARAPISYGDLVAALRESLGQVESSRVERLVDELWEQTLLLSDLRPPLTTPDPAAYVARRLTGIAAAADELLALEAVLAGSREWDGLPPSDDATGAWRRLVESAGAGHGAGSTPLMVDMAWSLEGQRINAAVGAEAARAAELLLRLTPFPDGLPYLAAYRSAFQAKYGVEREVPLLDVLDPHTGLGPPGHYGGASHTSTRRTQALLELAVGALRDRRTVVELDAATLARLETTVPNAATAPRSLDLYVFVAARSPAALDAGEFQLVVGPNLGAMAAGRNLARFADLLAPGGEEALRGAALAEAPTALPDRPEEHDAGRVMAELVYLPRSSHAANVVLRPAVRDYEIVLGASPGVPHDRVIPVDELVLGVRDGRFCLRWPRHDVEVVVCAGHMLNTMNAPALVAFLSDLARDRTAQLCSFDWGPASSFPFLPRVQAGRIVLAPAEWRIDTGTRERALPADEPAVFAAALERWRAEWHVPRLVALAVGDNRLLLDLENAAQREELREELRGLAAGGALILQEMLPSPDQVWLPGPGGRYVSELVVSMALRQPPAQGRSVPSANRSVVAAAAHHERQRPPGSDWLYAKLYGPRNFEDDLIAGPVLDFAEAALADNLAQRWFFVRYSDPDPHIRLRFGGAPATLMSRLIPELCAWGSALMRDGMCLRFGLDTYERELERYGGTEGLEVSESVFAADSRATAMILRLIAGRQLPIDRAVLSVIAIDELLAGLELDEQGRLDWYRSVVVARRESGAGYRQLKTVLRSALGDDGWLAQQPGGAALGAILAERRAALAPLGLSLRALDNRGALTQPLDALYASLVHLHCNRLHGAAGMSESSLLGLLSRTRESLRHAPLSAEPALEVPSYAG